MENRFKLDALRYRDKMVSKLFIHLVGTSGFNDKD